MKIKNFLISILIMVVTNINAQFGTGTPVNPSLDGVLITYSLGNSQYILTSSSNTRSAIYIDYNNDFLLDYIETKDSIIFYKFEKNFTTGFGFYKEPSKSILFGSNKTSTIASGDYNNDGKTDFIIEGMYSSVPSTFLYTNNGNGTFTKSNISFIGLYDGDCKFSDFNNDGYQDIVLTGYDNTTTSQILIYTNNGNGTFSLNADTKAQGGNGLYHSTVHCADMNKDGRMDIIIFGIPGGVSIFINNGDGTFTFAARITMASSTTSSYHNMRVADVNNDGNLDILAIGNSETKLLLNNTGTGITYTQVNLQNLGDRSSLDIAPNTTTNKIEYYASGYLGITNAAYKYPNNYPNTNTVPNAPSALSDSIIDGVLTLNWNNGTDDHGNLTYNVFIGTTKTNADIVNPNSNLSTGFRYLIENGNASNNNLYKIMNLPAGKYYWSVQSIDGSFVGSSFANVDSFIVKNNQTITFNTLPAKKYGDASFALTATASSNLGISYSSTDTSVATITANMVTIKKVGTTIITAYQVGNGTWYPADSVNRQLVVNKANQIITIDSIPAIEKGKYVIIKASTNSGLPLELNIDNTIYAQLHGDTIFSIAVGSTALTVFQAGNDNYNSATASKPVIVNNATLSNNIEVDDIVVYPNPTSGKISIKANNLIKTEVTNIDGKDCGTYYGADLDLSKLPAGNYFIMVYTKDKVSKIKILLNK